MSTINSIFEISGSGNTNLNYNNLYAFEAQRKNKKFINTDEQKEARKKVRRLLSDKFDANVLEYLKKSGFYAENQHKEKVVQWLEQAPKNAK